MDFTAYCYEHLAFPTMHTLQVLISENDELLCQLKEVCLDQVVMH